MVWKPLLRLRGVRQSLMRVRCISGPSTDEKAAEIQKEALPFMRKYGMLLVPVGGFLATSITIINNGNIRYYLEELAPSYVQFIRDYHGFSDEDLSEIHRVKSTLFDQSQPSGIAFTCYGGNIVEIPAVDSRQSLSAYLSEFEAAHNTKVCSIEFKDAEQMYRNKAHESDVNNSHTPDSHSEWALEILRASSFRRGLWDFEKQSRVSSTPGKFIKNNQPISKTLLLDRYNGYCEHFLKGMNNYLAETKKPHFSTYAPIIAEQISPDLLESNSTAKSRQTSVNERHARTQWARETVAKLQVRVQELQHERKIGSTRDMDAVEEDIRSVQAQITQIRRQHLNNFYYF